MYQTPVHLLYLWTHPKKTWPTCHCPCRLLVICSMMMWVIHLALMLGEVLGEVIQFRHTMMI